MNRFSGASRWGAHTAVLAAAFVLSACATAPHGSKNGRIVQESEIIKPVVYQPSEADEVKFDDYKPMGGRQASPQGRQTPDAKAHGSFSTTEKKTENVILHGN